MITKRDDRRYRFAIAMASHRTLWARIALKQVAKAHKFDRNHVTQIMRATDSSEAALEHINSYFEGQSRVYWANALRIIWKETGKASIAVMHDVLAGKDFFSDYSMITEITKDPVRDGVQLTWDQLVEDKITSRTNKVVGVTHARYEQIQDIMAKGVKNGSTHYEIGQQIESNLDEVWKALSENISRTEVNSAMNAAMLEDTKAMAPDLNKVWACTFLNSRQDHMDADGQSVPQSEPFVVGGEEMMEPGDDSASADQIVNCACTIFFERLGESPD
ncbi:MAG: phage head morphogenesis protein [Euryarchaeota archaeon]|nr:phage head morphogenesis protein [Euryarchaeota archaeon]